jgi:hypothetical protein
MPSEVPKFSLPGVVVPVVLLFFFVAVLLNLWKGATVKKGIESLESVVSDWAASVLLRVGGEEVGEDAGQDDHGDASAAVGD